MGSAVATTTAEELVLRDFSSTFADEDLLQLVLQFVPARELARGARAATKRLHTSARAALPRALSTCAARSSESAGSSRRR